MQVNNNTRTCPIKYCFELLDHSTKQNTVKHIFAAYEFRDFGM